VLIFDRAGPKNTIARILLIPNMGTARVEPHLTLCVCVCVCVCLLVRVCSGKSLCRGIHELVIQFKKKTPGGILWFTVH
jgi:hypothetical protein